MDQQQFWTLVIAVGGLVIALISVLWNVYLHATSRPNVKVTVSIMKIHPLPIGFSKNDDVLLLEAVNMHHPSVTIEGFCGQYYKPVNGMSNVFFHKPPEQLAPYTSSLPFQIKEGEVCRVMALADAIDDMDNIKFFYASDTTGRNWYSSERSLRRVSDKLHHRKPTRIQRSILWIKLTAFGTVGKAALGFILGGLILKYIWKLIDKFSS